MTIVDIILVALRRVLGEAEKKKQKTRKPGVERDAVVTSRSPEVYIKKKGMRRFGGERDQQETTVWLLHSTLQIPPPLPPSPRATRSLLASGSFQWA